MFPLNQVLSFSLNQRNPDTEPKFNGIVINYARDGEDGWRPVVTLSLRDDVPADIKQAICEHGQSLANDIIRWYRIPTATPGTEPKAGR